MRAEIIGDVASEILGARNDIEVIAAFKRSFYARDGRGRIVCFLDPELEPGPLHILCSGWVRGSGVREGTVLRRNGEQLFSPVAMIDLAGTKYWVPPSWPLPELRDELGGLTCILELLTTTATGGLIGSLLGCKPPSDEDTPLFQALKKEVEKGLAEISCWLASPTPETATAVCRRLLGLGPGLTPTGDDILAGAFLALHALGKWEEYKKSLDASMSILGDQTNQISAAHLAAAAGGQAAAAFHECLASILSGGEGLPQILPRIGVIGHSSGWDSLLGIVWVMRYFFG